jgi:homocysteine S-methyltransferase
MARTGVPYVLSFVARADGCLLDDTPLVEVIQRIDDASTRPPAA